MGIKLRTPGPGDFMAGSGSTYIVCGGIFTLYYGYNIFTIPFMIFGSSIYAIGMYGRYLSWKKEEVGKHEHL